LYGTLRDYLRRLSARGRRLWQRAKQEHSSPREVGWSVAVGVFCGCTPFIGFHMWLALALATLLRLNRLWAFLGSRISTNVIFAWLAYSEIQCAHRLRTGAWLPLSPRDALAQGHVFGDWLVGSGLVGAALAAIFGLSAYVLARRWQSSRGLRPPASTPPGPLPPSSESPPSAPPAPTS
jgi:hypothetical protein